jgi:hypothetical protein
LKAPAATPPAEATCSKGPVLKAALPKGAAFRAILAERTGLAEPPATSPATVAPGPVGPARTRTRPDEPPAERDRDPEPRAAARTFFEGLREPGPASFGPPPAAAAPVSTAPGAVADPTALAAVAERVLRSLRVGTDAQGRSLVQLDLADGPLAGCRVELRRVSGGVTVDVRDGNGAADARESLVVEALRRRGIEVV